MALNKFYYVYGLDTSCFYTDEENEIDKKLIKARIMRGNLKRIVDGTYIVKSSRFKNKHSTQEYKDYRKIWCDKRRTRARIMVKALNKYISEHKQHLKQILANNINLTRNVRQDKLYDKNGNLLPARVVSTFDGSITRSFEMKPYKFNPEMVIIRVYFFDIAKSIVENGFYLNGEKYRFFSASAGQIRTKKLVALNERILNQNWNKLTAGLTIDKINAKGGMNINKYLAYLALSNSATDLWQDFDIDKCIVVDDFENQIEGTVDFIDDKTYEINRVTKELDFTQTDGCGMILPVLTNKNFMVRLPWVKGLLAKFDFVRFITDTNASPIVKDIYGDEHNVIEENIQIIFTKSQFKMWKFYDSWEQYKDNFKKFGSTAGICNIEEDFISDSVINYQMIQTLSDLEDNELDELAEENVRDIRAMASDMRTMLKIFGAVSWNKNKNGLQKCLEKYPELLSDVYCRQTLKDIKAKLEKELWSARFNIGAKYTFVIPDLYAFCEHLFLGIKNPNGLLKNGEVCCKLYRNGEQLDCLRSPHLYMEHCIRENNTTYDWFDTKAIYVSCHDMISKVVMCDWDGDKLLISNNRSLINAALRNIEKFNIVPLYYNMSKANAEEINPQNLFKGLRLAYTGGNIGSPSNDITKIWNIGEMTEEKLNVIKWLVMEVNFTIDYAKTLYKPKRPDSANNIIKKYTKAKVPYFFKYAKDKKDKQVERISECVVDRISEKYPVKKLNFNFKNSNIGKFDYKVLMDNPNVERNDKIIELYKKETNHLNFNSKIDKMNGDKSMNSFLYVIQQAKENILNSGYTVSEIVDNLILELFVNKKSVKKKAFWVLFGNEVFENISKNLNNNFVQCEKCKKRFYRKSAHQKYCDKCSDSKIKTIVCKDCGKSFAIPIRSQKIRCDTCNRKKRAEDKAKCIKNKKVTTLS